MVEVKLVKKALLGLVVSSVVFSMLLASAFGVVLSNGYLIVPLKPISDRNVFYGGSVIDVKFKLLDPNGALVTSAAATLLVDEEPAVGRGQFNTGNFFTIQGQNYVFKLDTSPLSAGFGSPIHTLTIVASVGGNEVAEASFTIALH